MSIGLPQKYGAQFIKSKSGRWQLYKYDKKTPNQERKKFGIEPLDKLLKIEKDMNRS